MLAVVVFSASHLAQYLAQLFDKLGLCGFWQKRVKRGGNLCLHISLVFNLKENTAHNSVGSVIMFLSQTQKECDY